MQIQGALVPELLIGDPIKWQKNKEVKKKKQKKNCRSFGEVVWFSVLVGK